MKILLHVLVTLNLPNYFMFWGKKVDRNRTRFTKSVWMISSAKKLRFFGRKKKFQQHFTKVIFSATFSFWDCKRIPPTTLFIQPHQWPVYLQHPHDLYPEVFILVLWLHLDSISFKIVWLSRASLFTSKS